MSDKRSREKGVADGDFPWWSRLGAVPSRTITPVHSLKLVLLMLAEEKWIIARWCAHHLMNLYIFFPEVFVLMLSFLLVLACNFTECQRREFLNFLVGWNGWVNSSLSHNNEMEINFKLSCFFYLPNSICCTHSSLSSRCIWFQPIESEKQTIQFHIGISYCWVSGLFTGLKLAM